LALSSIAATGQFDVERLAASQYATASRRAQSMTEKPFVSGGKIDMQLDGGTYAIRPAADDHIRVAVSGNVGNARVEVTTNGTHADVIVKETPHTNFQATIDVPKASDLAIRLRAGNLAIAAIAGNKDIESKAGNTEIAIADPNEYASVDASVKAGGIDAGVFGASRSGVFQHFTWSGRGEYTLRANVVAGNLVLRSA
jgi:hypothetical protein